MIRVSFVGKSRAACGEPLAVHSEYFQGNYVAGLLHSADNKPALKLMARRAVDGIRVDYCFGGASVFAKSAAALLNRAPTPRASYERAVSLGGSAVAPHAMSFYFDCSSIVLSCKVSIGGFAVKSSDDYYSGCYTPRVDLWYMCGELHRDGAPAILASDFWAMFTHGRAIPCGRQVAPFALANCLQDSYDCWASPEYDVRARLKMRFGRALPTIADMAPIACFMGSRTDKAFTVLADKSGRVAAVVQPLQILIVDTGRVNEVITA